MQLNRINVAAVMPSATDKYRQVGDTWERGMALLAWKLGSRGTVVDVVVVLSNGDVDGSRGSTGE